jgi:hypothetical protein
MILPRSGVPASTRLNAGRLRHLGVIKRVTGTYRYYLTRAAAPPSPPPHRTHHHSCSRLIKSAHKMQTLVS